MRGWTHYVLCKELHDSNICSLSDTESYRRYVHASYADMHAALHAPANLLEQDVDRHCQRLYTLTYRVFGIKYHVLRPVNQTDPFQD